MNPDLVNVQPTDISSIVGLLENAVTNKWWGMVAALVLSLLLMALRLAKPEMSKAQVLLASAASATLPSIILVLSKPGIHVADVVGTTLQSVIMAAGLWNLALKEMGGAAAIESRLASVLGNAKTPIVAPPTPDAKEDPSGELFPKDKP